MSKQICSLTLLLSSLYFVTPLSASGTCPDPRQGVRQTIRVADFGAIGDGIHDDRPAIQNALNCAHSLRSATVVFGPGTYELLSSTDSDSQLHIVDWNQSNSIQLIGTNTVLHTSQINSSLLTVEGNWYDGLVQGITFRNTHGVTDQITIGLLLAGGGQNGITNWTIQQSVFQNFSRHIVLTGVTGALIQSNRFLMEHGRDSGTSTYLVQPNVGIWMFNNTPNGTSVNIEIGNNLYDGCSNGTANNTSQMCGDGFVFGKAFNVHVYGNHIQRFSAEGIYLSQNPNIGIGSPLPPIIENNTIDATPAPGDAYGGGLWGIRCDHDNSIIRHNVITNALTGIFVDGTETGTQIANLNISSNQIFMAGSRSAQAGMFLSGARNAVIDGNTIVFPTIIATPAQELTGIRLSGGDPVKTIVGSPVVTNNSILAPTGSSTGRLTGVFLQWAYGLNISKNMIHGLSQAFHVVNYGSSPPSASTLVNVNTLQSNVSNYAVN